MFTLGSIISLRTVCLTLCAVEAADYEAQYERNMLMKSIMCVPPDSMGIHLWQAFMDKYPAASANLLDRRFQVRGHMRSEWCIFLVSFYG